MWLQSLEEKLRAAANELAQFPYPLTALALVLLVIIGTWLGLKGRLVLVVIFALVVFALFKHLQLFAIVALLAAMSIIYAKEIGNFLYSIPLSAKYGQFVINTLPQEAIKIVRDSPAPEETKNYLQSPGGQKLLRELLKTVVDERRVSLVEPRGMAIPFPKEAKFISESFTFAVAYGSTPKLAVRVDPPVKWRVENVTTTGFSVTFERDASFTGDKINFEWTSIGD